LIEHPRGIWEFVADAFVLLQYTQLRRSDLEQAVALLARRRLRHAVVQSPRQYGLFGRRGASGLRHEVDAGIVASSWIGLIEVKSSEAISKNDLLIFDGKTMDLYLDRIRNRRSGPHYRFFLSAVPIQPEPAAFAMQRAIILVEPRLVPIPFLLRLVGALQLGVGPTGADMALLIRSTQPMEGIWRPQRGELLLLLDGFDAIDANAARKIQGSWTDLVLDGLEGSEPGWAAKRWRSIEAHLNSAVQVETR